MRPSLTGAAFVGVLALVACDAPPPSENADANSPAGNERTSLQDVQDKTGAALSAAVEYARQEYKQKIAPRIDQLQAQADQLRERIEQSARDAQPEIQKRLEQLRERLADAEQQLAEAQDAGEEAWQQARAKVEDAMTELRQELEDHGVATTQPAEPPASGDEGGG